MGRTNSSGVAVDKPHLAPDVAARVAPVPQDDAARSRSSSAHVHVPSQVDAHLARFVVFVRRAAYALARCYCVGVARLSANAAAFGAELSTDSAALRTALLSAPLWARQAASGSESLLRTLNAFLETSRACLVGSTAALLALFCLCCVGSDVGLMSKTGLRRLQRLSGARLGADQRTSGGVRKV